MVRERSRTGLPGRGSAAGLVFAILAAAAALAPGCASTEFFPEGTGLPTDRASGAVPAGSLGACKRPNTKRPPIVSQKLWDDVKPCTAATPLSFARLGYGRVTPDDPEAEKQVTRILDGIREGQKPETGNGAFTTMLRSLRDRALQDPLLRDRVVRDPSRQSSCDFTYLLGTMSKERAKLDQGEACPAEAYDPKARAEVCLFDPARTEAQWLASGWDCMTHTGVIGEEESCHRLCAYDDYCARQVSCAAPDVDLVLCALGVCLPEARAGFYGR